MKRNSKGSNEIGIRRNAVLVLTCLAGWSAFAASQADQGKLASANTSFAFGLLKQIAAEQPGQNIFISPYSVSAVLQMVCNGAAGKTKQEMAQVLGTSGLAVPELNQACKDLDQSIRQDQTNVTLAIANSIWYRQGIQLKPGFVSLNRDFYGAQMGALDFQNPQATEMINAWADKNTRGRIKQILQPPLDPATEVILANAIYFKGNWADQFDKKQTKERTFHLQNGRQKQVQMMQKSRRFSYLRGDGFQAVRLPYAGGHLAMYVFLPDTDSSLAKLLATLNRQAWQNFLRQFQENQGTLVLPRFRLDYSVELKKPLNALGMNLAFGPSADFSAMATAPLHLSAVKQKSFVEVNEEGTEAAAVTTGVVTMLAVRQPAEPFEMIMDRPFFFVIYDNAAESALFMGVVLEPMEAAAQ